MGIKWRLLHSKRSPLDVAVSSSKSLSVPPFSLKGKQHSSAKCLARCRLSTEQFSLHAWPQVDDATVHPTSNLQSTLDEIALVVISSRNNQTHPFVNSPPPVVQGSRSHPPRSCWTAALLLLLWIPTWTKPTPGWQGRRTWQSDSSRTHPRRTWRASSAASRASWGAPWLPRQGEREHSAASLLSPFHHSMIFSPSPVLCSEADCPGETKPTAAGTVNAASLQSLSYL